MLLFMVEMSGSKKENCVYLIWEIHRIIQMHMVAQRIVSTDAFHMDFVMPGTIYH